MTNIRVHNPCNSHTRYYRNYNLFWDKFTDYLKDYFVVEENRYFEDAHSSRFKVELQKGQSSEFLLLECEYVIENLDNGEFVIMSVADDLTHAILNEKDNPFLKKVLISQFDPTKIWHHVGNQMHKYSPWTYFQAIFDDLDEYYSKRKLINNLKQKLYFKGTSLEDRSILSHIDKDIITELNPVHTSEYFNDLISHKLALSVDGRGEFCYRDVECFGIGVPMLRFEYLSVFNAPLIPNYHYISIPRPSDMSLYRTGNKSHAELIERRYLEVIDDSELLNFISNNAREYYNKNFEIENKIKNTFNIINLNAWVE
jgi:hypothetical protein